VVESLLKVILCGFEAEPKKDIKPYIKNIIPTRNKAKGSQYFLKETNIERANSQHS
jgi:hypothetical protein